MPKPAGQTPEPANKSAEGSNIQGNPTSGHQSTARNQMNPQAGLETNKESMEKEELTSRNKGKGIVEKHEQTDSEKTTEKLKTESKEDKKKSTAAILEERRRPGTKLERFGPPLDTYGFGPAQEKDKGKPVFESTPTVGMRSLIPAKPKTQAKATGKKAT